MTAPPASTDRRDPAIVAAIGLLLLGALVPALGVWEPWEAENVAVVDAMRDTGLWLRVQTPTTGDALRAVPDLPYGWWPLAGSISLFGATAFGLRLPALLAAIGVLVLLFVTVRRFFGRQAAWLSTIALLCMPLFTYHARFVLGSGLEMSLTALAALAALRVAADDDAGPGWAWGAWLATAAAAAVAGFVGLAAPLAVLVGIGAKRRFGSDEPDFDAAAFRRRALPIPAVAAGLAATAAAWGAALWALPEGQSQAALIMWSDVLDGALKGSDRPSFDLFVHQLGFGLFPLGALVPFAFAEALWLPPRDDEPRIAGAVFVGLALWFAAGFLVPALSATYSHFAVFLAAPAVAAIVGVYLGRVLRSPPQPLMVLGTILVLALLDSNLKHETQLLADTLVGERVDAFPKSLEWWRISRLLSMAFLGVLMVYQGGVHRFAARFVRWIAYPPAPRPRLDWAIGLISFAVPFALLFKKAHLDAAISYPFWGTLKHDVRRVIIAAAAWALTYGILWGLYYWRARAVGGRSEGRLSAGVDKLAALAERPRVDRYALFAVLGAWALFLNLPIARALTLQFSQRGILEAYEAHADAGEPLYRYRLPNKNSSFYARDLAELSRAEFTEKADAAERFFAIIPRDQLAAINTEFRKITERTLPVLDDRGARFLLVSNRLDEGDTDRNPINSALIDALPEGANPVSIVFDDKIELAGWKLEPAEPSPGSPLTMHLYWRALVDNPGNWKVFVHIDAAGQRIHGDHEPVEGLFPTRDWQKGDLIDDTHKLVVKRTISPARFTFYAGLYRGGTRMTVTKGPKDNENRARLGTVEVK